MCCELVKESLAIAGSRALAHQEYIPYKMHSLKMVPWNGDIEIVPYKYFQCLRVIHIMSHWQATKCVSRYAYVNKSSIGAYCRLLRAKP